MGFGDFMKGMQSGMSTMDDLKNSSQRRKLYDRAITEDDASFDNMDYQRARAGLPPLKRASSSRTFLDMAQEKLDPVLSRLMEKLGRGTGTTESPVAAALPTAEEVTYKPQQSIEDVTAGLQPEMPQYAGGSPGGVKPPGEEELGGWADDKTAGAKKSEKYSVDSKEEIANRAERARAASKPAASEAIPTQVVDRSADRTIRQRVVEGAKDVAGKAKKHATTFEGYGLNVSAPEGAGLLRRGASTAARVGGRALATAGIMGAASGGIRGALDAETTGDGFWSDVGQRAVGAGKGALDGFLDPLGEVGRWQGDGSAPAAPAPTSAADPRQPSGPSHPRRYPGQGRSAAPAGAAAPGGAIPENLAKEDPLAGFDITKVKAADIPNFSNKDWEQFRDEQIKSLVMGGMSYAEAWDKVDQQVVATQQRGFLRFGNQARELLAVGDLNGAASAVRAAFQYFPSTTDLQVGQYNGHLVAFSVDEDTGKQVGTPMVLTPETLDSVLSNFSDRNAWVEHAQDRRKLDQADRELDQGDKRLDIMEGGLNVERENAISKRLDVLGGSAGGGGGLKQSDIAAAGKYIDDWAFQFQTEDSDPALPSALKALAEAEFARKGGGEYQLRAITMRLEEMLKAPGGPEVIIAAARRLASGQ